MTNQAHERTGCCRLALHARSPAKQVCLPPQQLPSSDWFDRSIRDDGCRNHGCRTAAANCNDLAANCNSWYTQVPRMRCEVQNTLAAAVLGLALLTAPVWGLEQSDYYTISLTPELFSEGLHLQVMHQAHAQHPADTPGWPA